MAGLTTRTTKRGCYSHVGFHTISLFFILLLDSSRADALVGSQLTEFALLVWYSWSYSIILEFIRENPCSLARFPSLYYRPQHHFSLLVVRADDGESEHFFWHDIEWVYIVEREEMCGSASLLCVIVVLALLRSSFGLYSYR